MRIALPIHKVLQTCLMRGRNLALVPGDTIGIIGGGQLGRMLAMAAARLGLHTIILDPQEDAPAVQCANDAIIAPYDDAGGLAELARRSAVITYEFENVDLEAIRKLEGKTPCRPNTNALEVSQDRLAEKQFFNSLGIMTAPFVDVANPDDLEGALLQLGGSAILKTRRFGYDGKGQVRLGPGRDDAIAEAEAQISRQPCILEGLVDFEREVSVIAARSIKGEISCFDVAENVHLNGILHTSTVPATGSADVTGEAHAIANKVLSKLDYIGVIGIEFFVMGNGGLIANEYAPRVHNSGHWTEVSCAISQFEQHVRAIAGLPLGNPLRHSDCVMENLIGNDVDRVPEILSMEATLLHLYGKSEVRDGRKMGHFTTLAKKTDS